MLAANAQTRDLQLCGQWTPDLDVAGIPDGDLLDGNGDGIVDNDIQDRLTTNAPLAAHGLWALAETRTSPGDPWVTQWSGPLLVAGPQGGCTDVFSTPTNAVTGTVTARLRAFSTFKASTQPYLSVYDNQTNHAIAEVNTGPTFVSSTQPDRVDVDLGSGDNRIDIAIILAWALTRESGGAVLSSSWRIYNTGPGGSSGGGGMDWSAKRLFVDTGTNVRRILHEMGHALPATLTNHWQQSYAWTNEASSDTLCVAYQTTLGSYGGNSNTIHYTDSDEATSASILEGFATYYAAQTVNRLDQGDCYVAHTKYDWDKDGFLSAGEDQAWYSCEGTPAPGLSFVVDDEDYWDDVCGYPPLAPPYLHSISSQLDWTRAFWDLDTNYTFTFDDMMQVLVHAEPTTWSHLATCPDLAGGCDDRPYIRMQEGAAWWDVGAPGLEAAWLDECVHGICR